MTDAPLTEREKRMADLLTQARPVVAAKAGTMPVWSEVGDDLHDLVDAIDAMLVEVTHAE